MPNTYTSYGVGVGSVPGWIHAIAPLLPILIIWSLFWKGLALWHSARHGHTWWFIFMLILNTLGILEIIYLLAILKLKPSKWFSK